MYAIKMESDKSLIVTVRSTIYQGEQNVDTIMFLVPKTYEGLDFANCTMLLRYILPNAVGNSEVLEMDPIPYNNQYYKYHLIASSNLTKYPGRIKLWLTALDVENNIEFKSGEVQIEVRPVKFIEDHLSDKDTNQLNNLTMTVAQLNRSKADSLIYLDDEKLVSLLANGIRTGAPVDVSNMVNNNEIILFGNGGD